MLPFSVVVIADTYTQFISLLSLLFDILIDEFICWNNLPPVGATWMPTRELTVAGSEALKVADALNSTTYRILQLISDTPLDVSTIAKRLDLSEAYVSEQIRDLEDLKLIQVSYGRGKRGIRKICELAIDRVTIVIKPKSAK